MLDSPVALPFNHFTIVKQINWRLLSNYWSWWYELWYRCYLEESEQNIILASTQVFDCRAGVRHLISSYHGSHKFCNTYTSWQKPDIVGVLSITIGHAGTELIGQNDVLSSALKALIELSSMLPISFNQRTDKLGFRGWSLLWLRHYEVIIGIE